MLYHLAQVEEPLSWQPGSVAEASLILDPTQNWDLFRSLGKWTGVIHLNEEYFASEFKEAHPHYGGLSALVYRFECKYPSNTHLQEYSEYKQISGHPMVQSS